VEANVAQVTFAFGLTLFAGLATGVGSIIAFFAKRTDMRFLAISLGFSAGVMLYVSFVEILPKAIDKLTQAHGDRWGNWLGVGGFFLGMAVIGVIDWLVPKIENPHEIREESDLAELRTDAPPPAHRRKLVRTGMVVATAIALHNFPEGMVTFLTALENPQLGVVIALAIAMHNIPEGISVSVPIYFATGSRRKAFLISFLSGLAEPVGALAGYFVLAPLLGPDLIGVVFAAVAGVMVFISLDELLPTAREYGHQHHVLYGMIGGMVVMALSLLLLL
jgi:zinc transporter, ZIP family